MRSHTSDSKFQSGIYRTNKMIPDFLEAVDKVLKDSGYSFEENQNTSRFVLPWSGA